MIARLGGRVRSFFRSMAGQIFVILTLGMTVADWWGVSGRAANALFVGSVDADGFFALLTERIGRL